MTKAELYQALSGRGSAVAISEQQPYFRQYAGALTPDGRGFCFYVDQNQLHLDLSFPVKDQKVRTALAFNSVQVASVFVALRTTLTSQPARFHHPEADILLLPDGQYGDNHNLGVNFWFQYQFTNSYVLVPTNQSTMLAILPAEREVLTL